MKKFPYQSSFAELIIKPMVSADKDKCLALASLEDIKGFLPNIDTDTNLDLLPVAFNACVANRVNKNKDVIDTVTAIAMTPSFINKPINVEHNRQKVIGMIMTAGFSEFGTDRPLTVDQVKGMTGPFNITLGGVVWRVVCPDLADHIEESSDPTSDKYLSVSASWELGFSDYCIALMEGGEKNLSQAKKIISDPKEVDAAKDKLTSLGGPGKIEDLFAYRMPSYDVLALGIGFTEKPAAEVKGVVTPSKEEAGIVIPEAFDDGSKLTDKPAPVTVPKGTESQKVGIVIPTPFTDKNTRKESLGENENKISQSDSSDVKIERNTIIAMKITSLKDITEDNVKNCTASAVSDFIASELTKGSSEWEKQKSALNTQLSEAQAASENLKKEHSKIQEELKQVQATVQSLATEKAEREKVEKFNVRMAAISSEYNLDDEVRAALVEEVKNIDTDEAFTKWQTRAKVLLKGFAKKAEKAKADDNDDDDAEAKAKEAAKAKKAKADMDDADAAKKAKASDAAATASAVASAIDNGDKDKATIPNGTSAAEPSLKDKYKEAFAKENFVITM
jgi:hypothetical protein